MLGVCLDSVALIQQAMAGRCTIFPLLLGGEAKFTLLALYRQAADEGWAYAEEARELAAALGALPCDALQEPASAAGAARWARLLWQHCMALHGRRACGCRIVGGILCELL